MSHIACKGKIASVLKELGFSKKMISIILKNFDKKNKEMSETEAEEFFSKNSY